VVERFVDKEWDHLQNSTISYLDDDFYRDLKLRFQEYCNTAFFPIFRFCLQYPITTLYADTPSPNSAFNSEKASRKSRPPQSHYL
jgi:hypothetical protein